MRLKNDAESCGAMDPTGHCSLNLSRSHDHARIRNNRVMDDDKTLPLGFMAGHNGEADLSQSPTDRPSYGPLLQAERRS